MARQPHVDLGQIVATPGAMRILEHIGVAESLPAWLIEHSYGRCPHLDSFDQQANMHAVREGMRILTAWPTGLPGDDAKIWIITEADRSSTTILLPSEY